MIVPIVFLYTSYSGGSREGAAKTTPQMDAKRAVTKVIDVVVISYLSTYSPSEVPFQHCAA